MIFLLVTPGWHKKLKTDGARLNAKNLAFKSRVIMCLNDIMVSADERNRMTGCL
jgi:hypothetical protein